MQFFSEIILSHDLLCTQITHCFCGALLFCEIKPDACELDVSFFFPPRNIPHIPASLRASTLSITARPTAPRTCPPTASAPRPSPPPPTPCRSLPTTSPARAQNPSLVGASLVFPAWQPQPSADTNTVILLLGIF